MFAVKEKAASEFYYRTLYSMRRQLLDFCFAFKSSSVWTLKLPNKVKIQQ